MIIAAYILCDIPRLLINHLIVVLIKIGTIVVPVVASQMMVGIESVSLVVIRDTVFYRITGSINGFRLHFKTVTACLKTVSVTRRTSRKVLISIIECPTMVECDRCIVVDQVEPVIAVAPRAATSEHIARIL